MAIRPKYRFLNWQLTGHPEVIAFSGHCMRCPDASPTRNAGTEAQTWCLEHAGRTGHRVFEVEARQVFVAAPEEE